jgi:hypothetical protein
MIASSPSPNLPSTSPRNVFSRPARPYSSGLSSTTAGRRRSAPATPADMNTSRFRSPKVSARQTRDASTQYSPQDQSPLEPDRLGGKRKDRSSSSLDSQGKLSDPDVTEEPPPPRLTPRTHAAMASQQRTAGSSETTPGSSTTAVAARASTISNAAKSTITPSSPSKRLRPQDPVAKLMPAQYEQCNPTDLVHLIASMLMELIRHNDSMPLANGGLTRFHSRAPPGISVLDYLQRLTTHATLSPPILLCMVYYIDRLCALWPKFTINSLTVHRYLIASATVASKGLSDSFWTNNTYARVGGVSLKELALLELEFLWRIEWRIVPKPELLVDYYRSLIGRCEGFELEGGNPRTSIDISSSSEGQSSGEIMAQIDAQ